MSFFTTACQAQATLGKHTATIADAKSLKLRVTKAGKEFVPVTLTLEDGRTEVVFGFEGTIKRMIDQLRTQLNDTADYKNPLEFLRALEGKQFDCWISEVTYIAGDGSSRTARQVDYVEPYVVDSENGPF